MIDRRVETLNVNDNILMLAVFPFSFDGNWSISEVFFFFYSFFLNDLFQIAPAEGMDAKQRMVIIVGPPEAQFKVLHVHGPNECIKRSC